jgi:hypothetical protein
VHRKIYLNTGMYWPKCQLYIYLTDDTNVVTHLTGLRSLLGGRLRPVAGTAQALDYLADLSIGVRYDRKVQADDAQLFASLLQPLRYSTPTI